MQVFTGAVPFNGVISITAMVLLVQDKRPPRPTHPALTDGLWALMRRCWDRDSGSRPEVPEVLKVIILSVCDRLINRSLAAHERIRLITTIFSDNDQVKAARHVSCNDTQALINVIDEVCSCAIHPQCTRRCTLIQTPLFFIRYWITLHQRHAGDVCAVYTRFVAIKPSFRNH